MAVKVDPDRKVVSCVCGKWHVRMDQMNCRAYVRGLVAEDKVLQEIIELTPAVDAGMDFGAFADLISDMIVKEMK